MSEVAVVHMDLMAKGGGEAVAMNAIEALQSDHDVALLTLTEPDLPALNEYFNTAVSPDELTVRRAGWLAPAIHGRVGFTYYILQNALLAWWARRHADEFDLLVSTINELGLEADSVQYVHFPFDWTVNSDSREQFFHPTVEEDSPYERLCTWIAGVDRADIRSNTLFANSSFTADVVEEAYGTRPEVLYPPVDTSEFVDRPWAERENGFVTVGRIERSKRIAELIEIVDGVRERGHDVHLHVIGPTIDEEYAAELAAMARDREHVELEGEVPRSVLVERLCTHRYGIHGKEYEHFGMAVAELVAAGAVTFVPSTGGQHEIVDDDRLAFDSVPDAVEAIDRVLSTPRLAGELRVGSEEIERRFGRERFRRRVREAVASAIDATGTGPDGERPEPPTKTVADGGDGANARR